jgi:putative sigma-54 modulation protein
MQIDIHALHIHLAPEHREQIRRRASFALSRLQARIARVEVRLSDINGTRGGVDKQCRVLVTLTHGPAAVVEDLDADLPTLIDRALARAGRVAAKRIEREARQRVEPRSVFPRLRYGA